MTISIRQQMWEAMAESPILMVGLNKNAEHSEPMHAQLDKEADNCFWFYTTKDNRVADGGKATVHFMNKDHTLFACIVGQLVEEEDSAIIDKYWSNKVAAWYDKGKDDPNLKMLRFDLDDAEIWTQDPTITGRIKLSTGVKIDSEEMGDHEKVKF